MKLSDFKAMWGKYAKVHAPLMYRDMLSVLNQLEEDVFYEDEEGRGVRYKDWCQRLLDENAAFKMANGLLRTRFRYYGRVLTKEANRKDILPAQEPE